MPSVLAPSITTSSMSGWVWARMLSSVSEMTAETFLQTVINVTFTPAAGGPASAGRTDADGKFALICQNGKAGAVPGKHKVVLQTVQEAAVDSNSDPKAAMEAYMKMRGGSGKKNTAPSNDPSGGAFPKEYSDASKTPLQYEVGTSGNEFDIVIP